MRMTEKHRAAIRRKSQMHAVPKRPLPKIPNPQFSWWVCPSEQFYGTAKEQLRRIGALKTNYHRAAMEAIE